MYDKKNSIRPLSIWTRFGCFLTGYNCNLLRQCSEASFKKLKKYVSALLIIMTIWGIVGYLFAREYGRVGKWGSFMAAFIAILIIIQIERQIILTVGKNTWAKVARFALGFIMAILGATVTDQILFKEDIKKQKIENIQADVNRIVPQRTLELRKQIASLDSIINQKDNERQKLLVELNKKPKINIPQIKTEKDSTGKVITKTVTSNYIPNPKFEIYKNLQATIDSIRKQKKELESRLLKVRDETEKELKERKGFLDELLVLKDVILKHWVSTAFYLLLFLFLVSMEMLVILVKSADQETDYDVLVKSQQDLKSKIFSQHIERK